MEKRNSLYDQSINIWWANLIDVVVPLDIVILRI